MADRQTWEDRRWTCGILAFLILVFSCCCGFCLLGGLFGDPQAQEQLPGVFWLVKAVYGFVFLGSVCFGYLNLFAPYLELWGKRLSGEPPFRWVHLIADLVALSFLSLVIFIGYLTVHGLL